MLFPVIELMPGFGIKLATAAVQFNVHGQKEELILTRHYVLLDVVSTLKGNSKESESFARHNPLNGLFTTPVKQDRRLKEGI